MSLSLANKYRPQDFDHLIGQDHISSILKYQAAHHTRQANYLFFWPRGTGKTSSARLFAKAINCTNLRDGNPCNECENCKAITNNTTMDIMEIDAASHTGVDNIREEIIDKVGYRPTLLSKKIIIIDEVHMLSKGAFNALLKTMEEPREWMIFILATTELNKVPETIISRCQVFNFKKVPAWLLINNLRTIADAEQITASDEWLAMIAKLSDGCVRDANKYLDQISVMGEVTADSVGQFLGVVSDQMISDLLEQIKNFQNSGLSDDFERMIGQVEELANKWVDLWNFPKQLMHYADEHFSSDPSIFCFD
jgi:DNA polymerase-3 subunit gamma/tau